MVDLGARPGHRRQPHHQPAGARPAHRRGRPGRVGPTQRRPVGQRLLRLPGRRAGRHRDPGRVPHRARRGVRWPRRVHAARGAAARRGGGDQHRWSGHRRGDPRRVLRRAPPGHHDHLPGGGQLARRPQAAAGVHTQRPLRGRIRDHRRPVGGAATGRERPAGRPRPPVARRGRPPHPLVPPGRRAGDDRRPRPLVDAGRSHGLPRLRTHRRRPAGPTALDRGPGARRARRSGDRHLRPARQHLAPGPRRTHPGRRVGAGHRRLHPIRSPGQTHPLPPRPVAVRRVGRHRGRRVRRRGPVRHVDGRPGVVEPIASAAGVADPADRSDRRGPDRRAALGDSAAAGARHRRPRVGPPRTGHP